jgi:hypothetical protein
MEDNMGHSEFDPAIRERRPWNAGRIVGVKRALKPQQVWAIRFWLDRERRLRDRALFDLAIEAYRFSATRPGSSCREPGARLRLLQSASPRG